MSREQYPYRHPPLFEPCAIAVIVRPVQFNIFQIGLGSSTDDVVPMRCDIRIIVALIQIDKSRSITGPWCTIAPIDAVRWCFPLSLFGGVSILAERLTKTSMELWCDELAASPIKRFTSMLPHDYPRAVRHRINNGGCPFKPTGWDTQVSTSTARRVFIFLLNRITTPIVP